MGTRDPWLAYVEVAGIATTRGDSLPLLASKRMRPFFATLLLLLTAPLWGESFDDSVDSIAMDAEATFSLTIEDGGVPLATGPGFRWFARGILGAGFAVADDRSYQDVLVTPSGAQAYYGDLQSIGIRYSTLKMKELTASRSYELLAQHLWDSDEGLINTKPRWRFRAHAIGVGADYGNLPVAQQAPLAVESGEEQRWWQGFEHVDYLAYGIRYNRGTDDFLIDGQSTIYGRIYTNNDITLHLAGPQFTIGRVISKRRWMFDISSSFLFGYARADLEQSNGFGEKSPNATSLIWFAADPTYSHHQRREEGVGAHAELRLVNSYLIHKNWTIDLIGRAFVTGPWHHANQVVQYDLPDFGLAEGESGYLAGANLMLGVTYLR